jgi:hypothetical protein
MKDLVLVESRTARENSLSNLSDPIDTLCKAKALVMAMWQGQNIATTQQLAEYYEIPDNTVRQIYKRNKQEFDSDGVKTVKGQDLRDVRDTVSLSQTRIPSLTVWTPRAAIRLGMLLQDSPVAQQLRTTILNIVEAQSSPKAVPATVPLLLPEIPKKKLARKLVDDKAAKSNLQHQYLYRQAYAQLDYRFGYDINHKKCKGSKLDRIEEDGHLDNLIAIMQMLWVGEETQ